MPHNQAWQHAPVGTSSSEVEAERSVEESNMGGHYLLKISQTNKQNNGNIVCHVNAPTTPSLKPLRYLILEHQPLTHNPFPRAALFYPHLHTVMKES